MVSEASEEEKMKEIYEIAPDYEKKDITDLRLLLFIEVMKEFKEKNASGMEVWDRHYKTHPSLRTVTDGYAEKMRDKLIATYNACKREFYKNIQ